MGTLVACAVVACALVASLAWVTVVAGPAGRAAAATNETCSFATPGTGTYASTLCWFDLSGYNSTAAASATGQAMSVSLPGGFTITFNLHVSGVASTPVPFPTFSDAYLGNNGHYTGVTGSPALYQNTKGTTTATLDNISVVDASGTPMTGYAFVGADAESTDSGESITWTSSTPLSLISNIGNACNSGALLTGVGTTTVKCSATTSSTKTGTAILAAQAPSFFTQVMVGAGRQAVAFGVLVSTVQLTTQFTGRVDPSDAATVSVSSGAGSVLASAATSTNPSATTGPLTVLTSNQGSNYLLNEQITSGLASNYTTSWSCTRNGAPDTNLPTGDAGPTATVSLGIGDFVNCTVTHTPLPFGLSLDKEAGSPVDVNGDGLTDAGDTITYSFTVTNTGGLTMSNIVVNDPTVGSVTCPQTSLDPGASMVCTAAPYTVTTADETSGAVLNTATASGTPPGSTTPVNSPPSSTSTPAAVPDPAVSVVKTADSSAGDGNPLDAGDTVVWSYTVTNTGNVNLTEVSIDDPTLAGLGLSVTCPPLSLEAPLRPGDSVTCTTSPYVVTAPSTAITDTATATGESPDGPSPPSPPSTVTVPAPEVPAVSLQKTAGVSPPADQDGYKVGDTIAYSYTVTNTGTADLVSVAVDDPTLGPVSCPTLAVPLAPGDSVTCTAAPYSVTQADVDAGHLTDTATATGTTATGQGSPQSNPATVTLPADTPAPAVSLTKVAAVTPAADQGAVNVGDTITYSYEVTNTGNVTLASVAVDDPDLSASGVAVSCPAVPGPGLAPGESVTCSAAPYTVGLADIDAGQVTDTATATGTDTAGEASPPSAPSTVTIPAVAHPLVSIVKSGFVSPLANQNGAHLNDTIAYSYLITNIGDATLRSVAVDDPTLGPVTCPSLPSPGLGPNGTVTCTGDETQVVTQADVDAGQVTDTATATGTSVTGVISPPSDPSTVDIPTVSTPPTSTPPTSTPPTSTPSTSTQTSGPSVTAAAASTTPGPASASPAASTTAASTGLSSINTDLGRWVPGASRLDDVELLAGAVGLAAAGWMLIQRRRRPRPAHAAPPKARWRLEGAVTLAVAATLVVLGAVGSFSGGPSLPSPARASAGTASQTAVPAGAAATVPTKGSGDAAGGAPTASLLMPALHIDAPLLAVGAQGAPGAASLTVPADINEVGWWDGVVTDHDREVFEPTPLPGQPGVAVVAGHVDSAAAGPGALYLLDRATVGDRVEVTGLEGATTQWTVVAPPVTVDKARLPPALFATSGSPRLALVTCGGPFDAATGHYVDNVIVWATPAGPV